MKSDSTSKGSLSTPFQNAMPATGTSPGSGVVGHHPVASVGHKADYGPGDIPLKFAEDMQPSKAALTTPFQNAAEGEGIKNPKKVTPGGSSGGTSKGSLETPFANAHK